MRKIDLILESIRDEYMINLLEEGTASELETLKTKKFLNENLNRIRKMLVEEGALEGVQRHLGNNWGKYLAGAGGGAALANGMDVTGATVGNLVRGFGTAADQGGVTAGAYAAGVPAALIGAGTVDGVNQAGEFIKDQINPDTPMEQIGQYLKDAAGNLFDNAGNNVGNIQDIVNQVQGTA